MPSFLKSQTRTKRGFSLIELMVVVALTTIVLSAVASVMISVMQNRRMNSSRLETRTNATAALSLIEYEAANAGYRFASAPFSVRVLQNISGAEAELAGSCPAPAVLTPGTDVVEFRRAADASLVPGTATSVTCSGTGACSVTLGNGAYSNPFDSTVPGGDGNNNVILFSDATNACAGIVNGAVSSPLVSVQLVKQDLTTMAGTTEYPSCPKNGMTMMRLGSRTRFLVCSPAVGDLVNRPGLYRQVFGPTNNLISTTLIQEGIEDLQIAERLDNSLGLVTGAGCTGAGVGAMCWCDDTTGGCTNYVPDATATGALDSTSGAASARTAYTLRGLKLGATAISTRTVGQEDALRTNLRPALFDHAAGAVPSADSRNGSQIWVSFPNIVMVVP